MHEIPACRHVINGGAGMGKKKMYVNAATGETTGTKCLKDIRQPIPVPAFGL